MSMSGMRTAPRYTVPISAPAGRKCTEPLSGRLPLEGPIKECVSACQCILCCLCVVRSRKPEDLTGGSPVRVGEPVLHPRIDLNLNRIAVSTRWPRNLLASLRPRALILLPHQDQQWERSLLDLSECGTLGIIC